MKNYFGISRDHSGSMSSLTKAAARDYNSNILAIREASIANNQDTIVSVVKCGVGAPAKVVREIVNSSITVLQPLLESAYVANGNSTPLFDSVGELIEMFEDVPDAADPNVSFVVMTITDGEENSSKKWSGASLSKKIKELQATDRWTFVFRVPRGYARNLMSMGIPEGNILEWDQTERGVQAASAATKAAVDRFYTERGSGVKSSNKFYSDLSAVSLQDVKAALIDISSEVSIWPVLATETNYEIRPFVELRLQGPMKKGAAFYQLSKTETVQDYKQICIRDKSLGMVYSGIAARDMLGLPHYGDIKLAPGKHGNYDIFIQSTSVNRKLVAGTNLLYWPSTSVIK